MANRSNLSVNILLVVLSLAILPPPLGALDCVYTVFTRTGSADGSGTNARISLTLYDSIGKFVNFSNLVEWGGSMEPGHDYFEEDNLDVFSGRARCLDDQPCRLEIMSDGTGVHPHWYCLYVKVVMIDFNGGNFRQDFIVEQRLRPPSKHKAAVSLCTKSTLALDHLRRQKIVSSTVG